MNSELLELLLHNDLFKTVAHKIQNNIRVTPEEGLALYQSNQLAVLGMLANMKREQVNGRNVYFNRNFHIEPTNICIHNCKFCSYRRKKNEEGVWDYSIEDMLNICRKYVGQGITEVHIVGGVHPDHNLEYYAELIREVKKILPSAHVKAFTAVELDYMIKQSGFDLAKGLQRLKEAGLDSIPGGGAEIFDEKIRAEICEQKSQSSTWLGIHEAAHKQGIPSNATMLYGHIESYAHRIDHLNRLRELQDRTEGFNAFIPLKYKKHHNSMQQIGEVSVVEVLKNFAVCRIMLDNIPHIKSYWPMLGKELATIALSFGADDMDGTIDDTTKIYSMAGAEETNPALTSNTMVDMIKKAGFTPIERDSVYNVVKNH